MILKDFTGATRDNLMIYVILFPIIFASIIRAFVPTVEAAQLTFAVHAGVGEQVISQIEDFGRVELLETEELVYDRVRRVDSVAGVVLDGDKIQVVFEGNEPEALIESYKMIISDIMAPEMPVPIDSKAVAGEGSLWIDLLTVLLIVMAVYMGGLIAGFSIVDEKETKAISAIAISPLNAGKYIISEYILTLVIGLFGVICGSLILVGLTVDYVKLLLVVVFSGTLAISIAMVIGAFADNQMSAMVLQKVTGWLYMIVPVLTFFVGERWQFLLYPVPTYWQVMMVRNVFFEGAQKFDFWVSGIMTFVTGAVMFLIMINIFRRKVRLG